MKTGAEVIGSSGIAELLLGAAKVETLGGNNAHFPLGKKNSQCRWGKGRKDVQILDSSGLSHYEEVHETFGDRILNWDLMARWL